MDYKDYVVCRECGASCKRVHTNEEIEKATKDIKDSGVKNLTKLGLLRQWICENGHVLELSQVEIAQAYLKKKGIRA